LFTGVPLAVARAAVASGAAPADTDLEALQVELAARDAARG